MANPDPSKTEQPTAKRLSSERDKGKIPVSEDVTSVVVLLVVTIFTALLTPQFRDAFLRVFHFSFQLEVSDWTASDIRNGLIQGLSVFANSFLLILFAIFITSIISIRAQTGGFFNTKPLEWKYTFLNLGSGLKGLMPDKTKIVKLFLTIGKVSIAALMCYFMIQAEMETLLGTAQMHVTLGASIMLQISFKVIMYTLLIFIIIAIIDIIWKKKKHVEDLMMSKDEIKDERKNADGDPKVKAKIRAKMQEILVNNIRANVQKSTVVITNPTHVAVAIQYDHGSFAPKVLAKGLRKKALRIKEIAKQENIPIIEAPPLARSLYRTAETGSYIDQQFFSAVAVILAKILKKRSGVTA